MRPISEDFRARLASGVTTFAHAWRLTRRDGVVLGLTDHDRDLAFAGVAFRAAPGMSAGAIEKGVGFDDAASAEGVLDDEAIAEDDLAAGLWDGTRVDIWRVDWTDPALRVHLFAGRLGAVRRGPGGFATELPGLAAACETPFGSVFSRFCDAEVGDARCGVDLEAPAFKGAGAVVAVTGAHAFNASGLGAFAGGWFTRGVLTWSSGARATVIAHRVAGAAVTLELGGGAPPVAGAAFTVTAGCDKRVATCTGKFGNVINFRGFPHMPGTEAIVAGVDPDQPLDGGSRVR